MSKAAHVRLETALSLEPASPDEIAVEVFRHGSLHVEMYQPEGEDLQSPHDRDEVYVVARGEGLFFDGERERKVTAGDFLFVAAGRTHRFEEFSSDFAVWVFFYGPLGGEGECGSCGSVAQE